MNKTVFWIVLMVVMLGSCGPQTKDAYIASYEDFINDVEKEYKAYTQVEWDHADDLFDKFTGEWYHLFKDELTVQEEIQLAGFKLKYGMFKVSKGSKEIYDGFVRENYDKLKEQIEYYANHQMKEDIDNIFRHAEKAGKDAVELVEEILEDLEMEIEDFKQKD